MAITVIEGSKSANRCVRVLYYDAAAELVGGTLTTTNAGTIECEYGTIAVKNGGKDPMWFCHDNAWHWQAEETPAANDDDTDPVADTE